VATRQASKTYIIDPFDRDSVYYGCQMVLRTTNAGVSWTEVRPDLSTKDPSP